VRAGHGPGAETIPVLRREPGQLADREQRHRRGELGAELDLPVSDELVHELAGQRGHHRFGLLEPIA
jgi:hypothetical protein